MVYLLGVLLMGLMIFVHELGHFLAAKAFKMPVKAFSIGLGPKILKFKKGETTYCLSALPFGGYVQIAGENDTMLPYGFLNQPIWKRFVVLIAGVTFNFIFAIIIFFVMILSFGYPNHGIEIGGTIENTKADGLIFTGDQLVSVNGHFTDADSFLKINEYIAESKESEDKIVNVEVLRDNKLVEVSIPLTYVEEEKRYMLGIHYYERMLFSNHEMFEKNIFVAIYDEFKYSVKTILNGLERLITGQIKIEDMQGPVGIVKTTGDIAKTDTAVLFYWFALLNINIAIMNLLPIPALDGGQIVFLAGEKILGKKRWNYKYALYTNAFFMLLILGFIVFISYHDVMRIFFK